MKITFFGSALVWMRCGCNYRVISRMVNYHNYVKVHTSTTSVISNYHGSRNPSMFRIAPLNMERNELVEMLGFLSSRA